ncbi:MAG: hypothetical protein QM737_20090 [Ferruginibacter sp.]
MCVVYHSMLKQTFIIVSLLSLLSCNSKLYTDQIDRTKFCKYFTIDASSSVLDGKTRKTASPKINYLPNDEVSDFIEKHSLRFDYLIYKTLAAVIKVDNNFDSIHINKNFCNAITTDTFYRQFTLLTSGERNNNNKSLRFSVSELMKIAARFFMCDSIRQKDTAIAYHICIGINGISELQTIRDYTVLEAFCIEAIFKNLHGTPKFISNFNGYINKSSDRNKEFFTDFKTHLTKVKDECYADMEKDKDLENVLLKYYRQNSDNINFRIE